ncbi:MAG: pilus assembly protein [Oscillospiraceae bacterium]|nr:pilus assembly protein [Oscillospiraceae bacterium]
MKCIKRFIGDTGGDAVVEAAILFPIMFMIFAGLVLLSFYLPVRATLQRATQQAVTAIATEKSDIWLAFDENAMRFTEKAGAENVYSALARGLLTNQDRYKAETIVRNMENRSIVKTPGETIVECGAVNYLIYKEITVTATRTIPVPVDLSFVGFPKVIVITASSTAVIQDVDGFIRDIGLINDVLPYLDWNLSDISRLFTAIKDLGFL